jgi:ketosteroid isomerase-like protein
MQKQPGHRYRTAGEMAQELSAARAQLTADQADATVVVPAPRRRNRTRRTSPRHLAVLGVATLATIWVVAARGTPGIGAELPAVVPGVTVSAATIAGSVDSIDTTNEPDTLLVSVRDAALAQRIQAQARGVPAPFLQEGDAEAAIADSLATAGRYSQAILALSSASAKWAGAIAEHERKLTAAARRPSERARTPSPPRPAATPKSVTHTAQSTPASGIAAQAAQAADHRRAIEQVVAYLATALQSRDIARLLSAYPNLADNERRMWERFFESTDDLTMNLELVDLTIQGDAATGTVRGTYTYATPKGVKQEPLEFPATFGRAKGEWSIDHLGRTATTS